MKRNRIIQYTYAAVLFTLLAFLAVSCNEGDMSAKKEDSKDVADNKNEERIDNNAKEKDAAFMTEAAEISLTEIKFGKLAQQKSKNADVKALGKMMEEDHQKALEELKTLAQNKQVTLPAEMSQDMQKKYDDLNAKGMKEFDREYTDMMVSGHEDAVSLFEKTLKDTKDVDMNNWIEKTLPVLRVHLEHSEMCAKNLK